MGCEWNISFLNQYSMGLNFTLLETTATLVLSTLSTHAAFGIPAMTALLVVLFTITFGQLKGGTITMVTPVCESFTYLQHLLRHPSRWKLMRWIGTWLWLGASWNASDVSIWRLNDLSHWAPCNIQESVLIVYPQWFKQTLGQARYPICAAAALASLLGLLTSNFHWRRL